MSITVFLPTRKGSQRVKNKNIKPFAEYKGGLLELKLKQLSRIDVDQVILSTNDEVAIEIAEKMIKNFPKLKIDIRPDHLASSTTNLSDLIAYVSEVVKTDHILWTHVTSPMVNDRTYIDSINKYDRALILGFDSLMSVTPFKNFLWNNDRKDIINRSTKNNIRWPQTQDLEDLYEINSAIFIAPRKTYIEKLDRLGNNPFLYEMSKIEAVDVDWEDDFKIAEAVYEKYR